MSIVMNMSSYEIERDPAEPGGGEDARYRNRSVSVALMCQQHMLVPSGRQMGMPVDLVGVDAELFLQKMGAFRR